MTEAVWRYREARAGERGLFPVDDEAGDVLSKTKLGTDVTADVKRRRNPRHHRLFFAIIKFLSEHSQQFEQVPIEKIKTAVKLAVGHVDTFIDSQTGEVAYVVRSISYAAMDQTEFNAFFDEACKVIANRWMPAGTTPESVRKELLLMVDGPNAHYGTKVA